MDTQQEINQRLIDLALQLGATKASIVKVADITFSTDFRQLCEMNSCGLYGQCWMCPPDIGEIDQLMAQAQSFDWALVYQTIRPLEDSFDIEGMLDAGDRHNALVNNIRQHSSELPFAKMLHLGSGGCSICRRCAKRDQQPCRFPDQAVSSLEAYGVAVYELANLSGMKYINGPNTVTYFGALLFSL